jgi:crotonobetainyl-CoA:carnitine CoA-transferase CaiB-like acyl-CoA transferase
MTALSHLRVVEYGSGISAPFCARLFADMGAYVVKVEPVSGDPSRQWGPFAGEQPHPEKSGSFHFLNAGKKSVAVDLDQAAELEFFHRLLAGADVLVENMHPAERARWGMDFDALLARHPHLVVISLSPYGRTGAWADRQASDLMVQAVSALCTALGSDNRAPLALPYDQAEYQGALHAMAAALCALNERERSGRGQGIDLSCAHTMLSQTGGMSLVTAKAKVKWQRSGARLKGGLYPTGFYEVADGHVCIASQHGRQWLAFIKIMGEPEWSKEEKNRDVIYLGTTGDDEPVDIAFRSWLKSKTRKELLAMGQEHNIILGAVNSIGEALDSPQFAFRDQWGSIEIDGQSVKIPKPGYLFEKTPTAIRSAGPVLNADGAALRASVLPAIKLQPSAAPRVKALDGIRVLDFGWNWAGPMMGQLLADMGAEVIRVESGLRQDPMRALPIVSYFFCNNNRSKLSVTFNIADPRGAEQVLKLVKTADIVLDNFAAGVMHKNGLGYDALKTANPKIIAVSMSMAGQTGPEADMRGFASIASAYVGLESLVGYPDTHKATGMMSFGLGDTTQAIQALIGALAALQYRNQTGEGQFVDMSQTASMGASMGVAMVEMQIKRQLDSPKGTRHTHHAPHAIYPAAGNDRWLALAVRDEKEWQALCTTMGRTDWAGDTGLSSSQGRRQRVAELDAAISAWSAEQDRDELVERLATAGIPAAPLLEMKECSNHPALSSRPLTWHHDQGAWDPCDIYATPWHFTATPAALYGPAPALGEQNDYVYRQLLGLSEAEVAALQAEKILA